MSGQHVDRIFGQAETDTMFETLARAIGDPRVLENPEWRETMARWLGELREQNRLLREQCATPFDGPFDGIL